MEAGGNSYEAQYVFNSIQFKKPDLKPGTFHLLQHFMGWFIETEQKIFDPAEPVLMDFRLHQSNGTSFVYIMPFSETNALVEYTVFSEEVLDRERYRYELKNYISTNLGNSTYHVSEEEFGVIPMTNHNYVLQEGNILNIGSAGGQTKPSTGYTFRFIQKQTERIIASLKNYSHPFSVKEKGHLRYQWFDAVLLNILQNKTLPGSFVFSELFRKNEPASILQFLDNETTPSQELKIMRTMPVWPFMKARVSEFLKAL